MFKNLLNAFVDLNNAETVKKTLSSSIDEIQTQIQNNVSMDDVLKYAQIAANSPVLHAISPKTARNLQIARMAVEGAAGAYSRYKSYQQASSEEQQPVDYLASQDTTESFTEQASNQPVDYSFLNNQEVINQQNEEVFWEQERVDYENFQYENQQNDLAYNQVQDDFMYHDMSMNSYSDY